MKIAIAGAGYVGFSLGVLLSSQARVTLVDPDKAKVDQIRANCSPVRDAEIQELLDRRAVHLEAAEDGTEAYAAADLIILAVPTDFDEAAGKLKTDVIESVLRQIAAVNPSAPVVIKSTVPIGYTREANGRYPNPILFSPEFLRENHALQDNREPDRIVVGYPGDVPELRGEAERFASLLLSAATREGFPLLIMSSDEAEAVKLFSNTYLAMRVSFFNELDAYAQAKGLDTRAVIAGLSADGRIGNYYNNPSFGYGGYCLPKDSRQLLDSFSGIPCRLIPAIVDANELHIRETAARILERRPRCVGVYRLNAKAGSDNCRSSSSERVAEYLAAAGVQVLLYEPLLKTGQYHGFPVCSEREELFEAADVILANRYYEELEPVRNKVYCRDLFFRD